MKVKCINNKGLEHLLIEGNDYDVYAHDSCQLLYSIKAEDRREHCFESYRFTKVEKKGYNMLLAQNLRKRAEKYDLKYMSETTKTVCNILNELANAIEATEKEFNS
jgi:hypothetical protein